MNFAELPGMDRLLPALEGLPPAYLVGGAVRDLLLGADSVDLDEVRRISEVVRGRFLYSGGISSLDDLRGLKDMRLINLAGVISGKALYEGRLEVWDARELLEERH